MILTTKLQKNKKGIYDIILVEKQRRPSTGKIRDHFGQYDQHTKKTVLNINRLILWFSKGLTLTNRIEKLIINKYDLLKTTNNKKNKC